MRIPKRGLSAVCIVFLMATAACSDPLDSSAGTATGISASNSVLNLKAGSKVTLRARLVDAQRNALGTQVDAVSDKPALLTVDSVRFVTELNETRIFLASKTTTKLDSAKVSLSASGITGLTKIFVSP